ncbi:sensor histidine kinase [Clostridium uliginosum]|uniref:histidine kinase n=1 Tax=Clostridium uliginosum TaxID=119641 RepID=A0A1I1HVZ7_9CLOT|nr:ATP-binding protein [Clostridium uliginosum]SFC27752.1 Histidine kinase-, DNA gyrase B-, and HSP90-like ATPase [Clostridium uliginosum]
MVISIVEMINTIIQSIMCVSIPNYCINNEYKHSKKELSVITFIIFLFMEFITKQFGNLSICVFITHITVAIIIGIFYRKNLIYALTAYTLIYFFIVMDVMIFGILIFGYFKFLVSAEYLDVLTIGIVYMPQFIMEFLCIMFKDEIFKLYKLIINKKYSIIILIIISFLLDFIGAFYLILSNVEDNILFENIIVISGIIFTIITTMYFVNIARNSNKILALNRVLDTRNSELRKIQNEYGKQISYMYDLYSMKRIDKIGEKLKEIINESNPNKENNSNSEVDINDNCDTNTLINSIVKKISEKEINVIVDDEGNLDKIEMSEMELYRIISNIVNNAVKAMNGIGIIIIKTYNLNKNLVINIENNGPKIEEKNIHKIFDAGFTTKDNIDKNHGYGLNIVKELVDKYNGSVNVKSTEESTKFEVKIPLY